MSNNSEGNGVSIADGHAELPPPPSSGAAFFAEISREMVRIYKEQFGCGPT